MKAKFSRCKNFGFILQSHGFRARRRIYTISPLFSSLKLTFFFFWFGEKFRQKFPLDFNGCEIV